MIKFDLELQSEKVKKIFSQNVPPDQERHVKAELREAKFFYEYFSLTNRLFGSVSDAGSHDIKILVVFPRNPILVILMKKS